MAECPLIIEDFVSSDWQKVLLSANEQTIYSYTGAFAAAESQSRHAGDLSKARVFGFLRTITSLRRNFDSSSEPYVPAITPANGWRSTSMDDISEFEIKLIEKLAPDIADPELKAYFNDLLWLKTRAHTAARNAIHLFLASAHHLECSAHWSECVARLQRAAVLAVSIGARKSELRVVSLRISETIDRISATDNGFASHSLMLVLLGVKEGDPHKWAPLCEVLAHRAEAAGKWQVARAYWGLKADWHGCAKEAAKQKEARLLSAETYVSESDCVLAMPRPSRFWAANLLAQAVEALRNAGATST
jgi:hypothetical protein